MGWFANVLRSRPSLGPALQERLQKLAERGRPPTRNRHAASRYVTVDVETTGLDLRHDRVLSIGAVAIERCRIDLAHCFEVVLRQPQSSPTANILIHRIGGQRQLAGADPAEALLGFLEFVDHAPLVAFRAEFDRTMIDRELDQGLSLIHI